MPAEKEPADVDLRDSEKQKSARFRFVCPLKTSGNPSRCALPVQNCILFAQVFNRPPLPPLPRHPDTLND